MSSRPSSSSSSSAQSSVSSSHSSSSSSSFADSTHRPSDSSSSPPPSSSSSAPSSSSQPPGSSSVPPSPTPSPTVSPPSPNSPTPAPTSLPPSLPLSNSSVPPSSSQPSAIATVVTTIITTNGAGSIVQITEQSTIPAPSQTGTPSGSSSKVGAIAGGAIGGIAGLILLIMLAWWIARRRQKNDFDGDFDPDNVGVMKRGRQDLVGDGPTGAEVTPYTFNNSAPEGASLMGEHNHAGYGIAAAGLGAGAAAAAGSSHSRTHSQTPESEYPRTESSFYPNPYSPGYDGQQQPNMMAAIAHTPQGPQSQGSSSVYSQPTAVSLQPRSAKEREAYAQRFGASGNPLFAGGEPGSASPGTLHLVTPSEIDDHSSNVVVHQDGGRVRDENVMSPVSNEIPPTYDSLPRDERP